MPLGWVLLQANYIQILDRFVLDKDDSTLELPMPIPVMVRNPLLIIRKNRPKPQPRRGKAKYHRDCQCGCSCPTQKKTSSQKGKWKGVKTPNPTATIHKDLKGILRQSSHTKDEARARLLHHKVSRIRGSWFSKLCQNYRSQRYIPSQYLELCFFPQKKKKVDASSFI